jgi:hypothetical protein
MKIVIAIALLLFGAAGVITLTKPKGGVIGASNVPQDTKDVKVVTNIPSIQVRDLKVSDGLCGLLTSFQ